MSLQVFDATRAIVPRLLGSRALSSRTSILPTHPNLTCPSCLLVSPTHPAICPTTIATLAALPAFTALTILAGAALATTLAAVRFPAPTLTRSLSSLFFLH